ncbi:MAG: hypothetical protein H6737_06040 [Alphaproteobacteria bacterium]|nr:hypothetical protein [Alphaproteobacteria bacterium]
MRFFVLVLALGCRGKTDQTGCPFDALGAVGTSCPNEGQECGETSLCDPCTSDLSQCEYIRCSGGAWVEVDIPDVCDETT